MVKMIVGLGNPGKKYENNRHNVGFMTIDRWTAKNGVRLTIDKQLSQYAETFIGTEKLLVVKPQTFMNLSGDAVSAIVDYYTVPIDDLLVVYDDMDLDVASLRLRTKGSAGGHNGMKHIIARLGTTEIKRIKIGIGHPIKGHTVINHVLSGFSKEEQIKLDQTIDEAVDAIDYWIAGHTFAETMSRFNHK